MKKIKQVSTFFGLILLFSSVLVGCQQSSHDLTKLTVAEVTHSVFYAPSYVAMSEGFFEEEGLDIELVNAGGADKAMAALISGEAQIGFMGPEATIYIYNEGGSDQPINFAQVTQRDGNFLISKNPNPNFTFSDLSGSEIIGGRKGGVPEMTLEYVLKANGLDARPDDSTAEVNVRTDISFDAMAGAFTGLDAEYVTLFEPSATLMEQEGKGYIVASIGEQTDNIPYTCYSATASYIEENSDIIQAFTNAIYKAQQWVATHTSEEIAESIQSYFTDLELEDLIIVVERYRSIDAWADTPVLTEESLNNLMEIMELADQLDQRAPYEAIVDTSYAENAIANID
ncbi:MAG: ABC transporter substrate-binding protein [Turicibacter sp.]|nr:ABC transporter substrate-binding protein [Turicibacter sp.]